MAEALPSLLARARLLLSRGRQSGWAMAEYFAYPLMMFAATPVFLHLLGTQQYGQWMLLLTFNGLGGLAGLGMGTAAIKEVSAHRGRGDLTGAADAVRSCLAVTLLSSVALSALLIAIGLLGGPDLLSKMGDPVVVRMIVVAAAILIALEQIDTVFAGAIRGMERFDVSARIEASAKFAMVIAALIAAWLTQRLEPVIWVTIAITLVRAGAKALIAARVLSTGPLFPRWEKAHVARAFAFGKWTWAQSIGSAMFATADRLIVGSVLGADALARYSICLQLAQQIQSIPAAGAQVLFPAISRMSEQGGKIPKAMRNALFVTALIALLIASPLIFFNDEILRIWVGYDIAENSSVTLVILCIAFVTLTLNVVPHFALLGLGRSKSVAILNISAGIVAATLCVNVVGIFGLEGAAMSRLAYSIVTLPLIAIAFSRSSNVKSVF